MGTFDKELLTC